MTETPKHDGDRIAKVIARSGRASRRDAEKLIEEGRVEVNGETVERAALNVTDRDQITVDGVPLAAPERPRLWLYHKPTGLVTTTRDEKGRTTIFDELPEGMPRVMTVGRLDLNSEGLLLLTNDGGIKRKLELPSTGWLRKYRVRVNGRPEDKTLEPLRQGIEVDGQKFQPMIVSLDRQKGANAWLTVGLREGKNREIRRAMADIGLTVNRLIRVSYGPFQLGQVKQGEVEEVRGKTVRDQLGLEAFEEPTPAAKPARPGRPGGKPGGKPGGRPGKPMSSGKSRKFGTQGPSDAPDTKGKPTGRSKPTASDTSRRFSPPGKPAGKPGGKPGSKPGGRPQVTRNRKPGRGHKSD